MQNEQQSFENQIQATESQIIHLHIMDGNCTQKVISSFTGWEKFWVPWKTNKNQEHPSKAKGVMASLLYQTQKSHIYLFPEPCTLRSPHTKYRSLDQKLASYAQPAKSSPLPVL